LLAANATNKENRERAAVLALESIKALENAKGDRSIGQVNPQGFFRALHLAAKRLSPEVQVSIVSATLMSFPADVASSLTEVTLQGLDNALRHSRASSIELILSTSKKEGLEIVIKDNGQGFRPERIPKNRIGLRTSIFQKAELVGASVSLESELGRGTRIVIRWKG
jgi:signal transduction histidine kinase